jgi:hypothetical protein
MTSLRSLSSSGKGKAVYRQGAEDGVLTGYKAEVKLEGYDGSYFTAVMVEFEEPGMNDEGMS